MRCIIAGGRDIANVSVIFGAIATSGFAHEITEVVSASVPGVDEIGFMWARQMADVPVKEFPADWKKHGKAAGPIRNQQMAEYADALILVWDGKSKGSANMLMHAKNHGLRIYEHIVEVTP